MVGRGGKSESGTEVHTIGDELLLLFDVFLFILHVMEVTITSSILQ